MEGVPLSATPDLEAPRHHRGVRRLRQVRPRRPSSGLWTTAPIASAAELSLWWAEVLSEERLPDTALAMLWLDPFGHRLGRCLRITEADKPDLRAARAVLHVHHAGTADGPDDEGHLAFALSRP